ncbi:hypothetical protein M6D93_18150 [Jatrophihabitans telluris]|uniref:NTF2-like N-terminal transpeptidase domain-containing protein n=1 Tax=Jatrophihabitans telluris TaxID=2038343 RepID=A0ABY4QXE7_9ACTN|nr:hypothetical protein [Jatrophihabitans telluris]UQX88190.1 hypothetical protein M6D93_18150 [Jatrophihabitans telluris]
MLIAGLLSLLLAVGLGGAAAAQFASSHSPTSVTKAYFRALAKGDAQAALALALVPPSASTSPYLTDAVLAEQLRIAPITDVRIGSVEGSGSARSVSVTYQLRFADQARSVSDTVRLVQHGSTWRLSSVASLVELDASADGSDRIMFAGRPLDAAPTPVFPGALPVTTDSRAVVVSGDPVVSLSASQDVIEVRAELTAAAKRQVSSALETALTTCLAASSTDPSCPNVTGGRPVPGSLHGTLTAKVADSSPVITLGSGGVVAISVQAKLNATWKIWDFNNIEQARSGTTTLAVRAQAAVADLNTVYLQASDG